MVSEDVFTYNDQVVKQLAMISEKTTIKEAKQSKASSVHEMMIAEVQIYSANSQVGDGATAGTLAAHEIGCLVKTGYPVESRMLGDGKTRMLDDDPKGGYR